MKLVHPYLSIERRRMIQNELKRLYVESEEDNEANSPTWILLIAGSFLFVSDLGYLKNSDTGLVVTVSWAAGSFDAPLTISGSVQGRRVLQNEKINKIQEY